MKANWNYPTTIWMGENRINDLHQACKDLKIKNPLFVTDKDLITLNIVQEIQYPDHYEYKEKDLESLSKLENKYKAKLITTEKDYLRISPFLRKKFDYVKLELKFQDEEGFKSNLKKFII